MIFASGDQTFFKVDESMLTGAMLTKINVVADKSTICKYSLGSQHETFVAQYPIFTICSAPATNTDVIQLSVD